MILTGVEVEDESVRKVLISCRSDLLEMCEEKILPPCGSQIHLTGTAEFLEEARNPGQFSYRMYYRGLGIRNRVTAGRIFISEGKKFPSPKSGRMLPDVRDGCFSGNLCSRGCRDFPGNFAGG